VEEHPLTLYEFDDFINRTARLLYLKKEDIRVNHPQGKFTPAVLSEKATGVAAVRLVSVFHVTAG